MGESSYSVCGVLRSGEVVELSRWGSLEEAQSYIKDWFAHPESISTDGFETLYIEVNQAPHIKTSGESALVRKIKAIAEEALNG